MKFQLQWISQASAAQRAGRAGRDGPGHCYRLYSSAFFADQLASYSLPELLRVPLDSIVLRMKSLGIHSLENFPFPTSPDLASLRLAERRLQHLGALSKDLDLTSMGKSLDIFPLAPRHAKVLALACQKTQHLSYAVAMVACLGSTDSIFDTASQDARRSVSNNVDSSRSRLILTV